LKRGRGIIKKVTRTCQERGFGVPVFNSKYQFNEGKITIENRPFKRFPNGHGVTYHIEIPINSDLAIQDQLGRTIDDILNEITGHHKILEHLINDGQEG